MQKHATDERQSTLDGLADVTQVEELASELEEWRDNLPENLQGGDLSGRLDEAIDALENVVNELDEAFTALEQCSRWAEIKDSTVTASFLRFSGRRRPSRAARAAEVADHLNLLASALTELDVGAGPEDPVDAEPEGAEDEGGPQFTDIIDKLEEQAGELEGVEFPGAFGR